MRLWKYSAQNIIPNLSIIVVFEIWSFYSNFCSKSKWHWINAISIRILRYNNSIINKLFSPSKLLNSCVWNIISFEFVETFDRPLNSTQLSIFIFEEIRRTVSGKEKEKRKNIYLDTYRNLQSFEQIETSWNIEVSYSNKWMKKYKLDLFV